MVGQVNGSRKVHLKGGSSRREDGLKETGAVLLKVTQHLTSLRGALPRGHRNVIQSEEA